ncbi:MAG: hypothetical protein ACOYYS_03620 [Chloroflexota bacterium]
MNANSKSVPEVSELEHDVFDYPRLYPSGWRLEDIPVKPETKKQPMPEGYDKFPEPKTFPGGWNLPD